MRRKLKKIVTILKKERKFKILSLLRNENVSDFFKSERKFGVQTLAISKFLQKSASRTFLRATSAHNDYTDFFLMANMSLIFYGVPNPPLLM